MIYLTDPEGKKYIVISANIICTENAYKRVPKYYIYGKSAST